MAIDVFTENHLVAVAALASARQAKAAWGRALVRTDINNEELSFLARSFRASSELEKRAKVAATNLSATLRALNRR